MRHLTSMELDDEQKLDMAMPIPMSRKPDYPCGLCLSLTEKDFEKLGLDPKEAEIGGLVHLFAMARVTSVSHRQSASGDKCCRVELQIEDMSIESEDDEVEEDEDDTKVKSRRY
jgi:hypothetical protein